jgi:hypothetical protein
MRSSGINQAFDIHSERVVRVIATVVQTARVRALPVAAGKERPVITRRLQPEVLAAHSISVFKTGVSRALRIEFLEQSVKEYSQLIKTFEDDRIRMIQHEAASTGAEAVRLREALAANKRGLDLLEEALARVQSQLNTERTAPESDPSE